MDQNELAFGAVSEVDEGEMDGSKTSFCFGNPPLSSTPWDCHLGLWLFDLLMLQVGRSEIGYQRNSLYVPPDMLELALKREDLASLLSQKFLDISHIGL